MSLGFRTGGIPGRPAGIVEAAWLTVEVVPVPELGTAGGDDRPPGSLANTKSTMMGAIPPRTSAHRRTSTPGGGRRRRALPTGLPVRDVSSTRVTAPVLPFDSV